MALGSSAGLNKKAVTGGTGGRPQHLPSPRKPLGMRSSASRMEVLRSAERPPRFSFPQVTFSFTFKGENSVALAVADRLGANLKLFPANEGSAALPGLGAYLMLRRERRRDTFENGFTFRSLIPFNRRQTEKAVGKTSAFLPKRIVTRGFFAERLFVLTMDDVVGVRNRKNGLAIRAGGKGLRRNDYCGLRT